MRIIAVATSAVFMHMDAHRPMPSPPSASAHIVAAIDAAEHASTQSCIIGMLIPVVPAAGMDFIMSAIMLIAGRLPLVVRVSVVSDATPRDLHPGRRTGTVSGRLVRVADAGPRSRGGRSVHRRVSPARASL